MIRKVLRLRIVVCLWLGGLANQGIMVCDQDFESVCFGGGECVVLADWRPTHMGVHRGCEEPEGPDDCHSGILHLTAQFDVGPEVGREYVAQRVERFGLSDAHRGAFSPG